MARNFRKPYVMVELNFMGRKLILKRLAGGNVVGGAFYTITKFETI